MAYTAPATLSNVTTTAASLNIYIRDNQLALKDPPSSNYESNEVGDYSSNVGTYADLDTDTNLTITTTGGDVICGFTGTGTGSGDFCILDIDVDGTKIINTANVGLAAICITNRGTCSFMRLITGLAAGVHTFKLQFANRNGLGTSTIYAGAGTANYDVHGQFFVREVS